MDQTKKILQVTLLTLLLIIVVNFVPVVHADAAPKAKLKKTTSRLVVGTTSRVVLKNKPAKAKVKWSVNKTNIIKITKQTNSKKQSYVKFIAVNSGKANIKASYRLGKKKKVLSCKITIIDAVPTQEVVVSQAPTALPIPTSTPSVNIAIDEVNFPDSVFRAYIVNNIDKDKNNYISPDEVNSTKKVEVGYSGITSLKGIEYFSFLTRLNCECNSITSLDISRNTNLEILLCNNNNLTTLNVSRNPALVSLWCGYNKLTSLDVSNNRAIQFLECYCNNLTALDVSNNNALCYLLCYNNSITTLDVSNKKSLTNLWCNNNNLTTLNLNGCTALNFLHCYGNKLTTLDVTGIPCFSNLSYDSDSVKVIGWSNTTYDPDNKQVEKVLIDKVTFPDDNFRKYVTENVDSNLDGELSASELSKVKTINVQSCQISSLEGINYFEQLTELDCSDNRLSKLEISNDCLTSLNVSNNPYLSVLNCCNNQLESLYIIGNDALLSIDCGCNNLKSLDISGNLKLKCLVCDYNELEKLDISKNKALETLSCKCNRLAELDVSANKELSYLNCSINKLSFLDLTNNDRLDEVVRDKNVSITGEYWN